MSVASAASHIPAAGDPSSARKLGRPIIPRSPTPPARRVSDSHQSQAQLKDCDLSADESQSPYRLAPTMTLQTRPASLPLQQTSPLRLRPSASSSRRTAIPVNRVHDKTSPHSDRSASARKPIHATSSILPVPALSSIENGPSNTLRQDAVHIALTKLVTRREISDQTGRSPALSLAIVGFVP